jgi:hypothetical protein
MIPRVENQPAALPPTPPLRVGVNVQMGQNPLGMWVQGPSGGGDFRHPFPVTVSGSSARVGHGLIIANVSVEPLIGRVPVSGDARRPQPRLKLSREMVNSRGESWVCVEVTPDADGNLDEEGEASTVEVVQRESPLVTEGTTGRAPLALLVLRKELWQVHQIAMFHYRYETSLPTAEGARRKHFFL